MCHQHFCALYNAINGTLKMDGGPVTQCGKANRIKRENMWTSTFPLVSDASICCKWNVCVHCTCHAHSFPSFPCAVAAISLPATFLRFSIYFLILFHFRYALDIIGTVAFGMDVNTLQNPTNAFRTMEKRVNNGELHNVLRQTCIFLYPR